MAKLLVTLLAATFVVVCPATAAAFPSENERLVAASRLWITVSFFHPYVAAGKVDWDNAFMAAIPKVRSAANVDEYSSALGGMLAQLQDDCTHVLPSLPCSQAASSSKVQYSVLRTAFETAFITTKAGPAIQTITLDLAGVRAVVRLSDNGPAPQSQAVSPAKADEDPYPSIEARILACAKIWGTIHYFFAYRDLMDEDWDETFAAYLPKFSTAKDALQYNLTLSEMLTHLTDSHTFAASKTLDAYFGEAGVGLRLRMLDKHPVVVAIEDPAASEAGVKVGDIVKRIDGQSIVDRFNERVKYVPASTPQRSSFDTLRRILNGPAGSRVTLSLETPNGEPVSATLTRDSKYELGPQRETEAVRALTDNIGYIDLDRVSAEEAEAAMRKFQEAKALILDLRSDLSGKTAAALVVAAHLTAQPNTAASIVTTPLALRPDVTSAGMITETGSTFQVKALPAPGLPTFKGKVIALADERTIGEAENAGLLFEAANRTEFIGLPSAGAVTETASFPVPGGITINYSARDIRHANGGKLQRLGFQPSGSAPDTAKSIRAGDDNALETARTYLLR